MCTLLPRCERGGASFCTNHDVPAPQPSIDEKGMTTMRLHRLHFSSSPCSQTLAINCPHSQRVSSAGQPSKDGAFAIAMLLQM